MPLVYGFSSKGKRTLLYHGFQYIKECDNVCGTTSWRCRLNKSLKCKARLVTGQGQVVADKGLDHNHEGNMATSLARKPVGEKKKENIGTTLMTTPSSSKASVVANLDDHVLMPLPKRALARGFQHERAQLEHETNDEQAIPVDLNLVLPQQLPGITLDDFGATTVNIKVF